MKGKKISKFITVLLMAIMLASTFGETVSAASYPSIWYVGPDTIVEGSKATLEFRIRREYNNEKYYVNIYEGLYAKPEKLVTSFSGTVYSTGTLAEVNKQIDTAKLKMKPGTYTAECYMDFYTLYEWHTVPKKMEYYFVVVKNTCKGKHKYDAGKTSSDPTCLLGTYKTYTCTTCKYKKKEWIEPLGHSYDQGVVTTEPTCKSYGYKRYTCKRCGSTKSETLAKQHVWDEGVVITAPTVSKKGLKDSNCTVCGVAGEVDIPPIFSDVYNDWYTPFVQYVYDESLMTGIKGTTKFQPLGNITKAQVAQVLYNMESQPAITDNSVFSALKDVYSTEWYADAVAWAYNTGVVTGDTNAKKFFPNANVTREQLALMMYRYAEYKGYSTEQRDSLKGLKHQENVSNWARTSVEWAVGAGLISGVEKNGVKDLQPQGTASRAQVAAILQRFCDAYPKQAPVVNESVAYLVEKLMSDGRSAEMDNEPVKVLSNSVVNGDEEYLVGIFYYEKSNKLMFLWYFDDALNVGFEYDVATGEALTPLYYIDAYDGEVMVQTRNNFDMKNFRADSTLDLLVIYNRSNTTTNAQAIRVARTAMPIAVWSWSLFLEEDFGLDITDLGFDSFMESLYSEQVVSETPMMGVLPEVFDAEVMP